MANKIVSLLLQVKNAISPGVKEASDDLEDLTNRTRELEKELVKLDSAQGAIDSLDGARKSAVDAEAAFDSAQLEVIRLKEALKADKTPELALALEKAKTEAKGAKKEWQDSAKSVTQLETAVKKAGGDLNDLATTQKNLSDSIGRTNGALKANKQQLDKARSGLNQTAEAAEKTGNSFGSFVGKAAALLGIVTIVDKVRDGLRSLASSVYDTGTQFELLSKRLSPEELGYIEEFARNTPQQLEGVADAFLKLRTLGIDPTNGSLQALVDTNAAMGGSQETLEGIILAVGQAWSKQKLQQEEALQLIERGVPVWDLLSDAIGKTVPELQDMATAGELGRREIQLLLDAMASKNMGEAQGQMDAMAGLVSNLQDRFSQFYRMIADAGVWEYLKGQLRDVGAWFDEMASSGQLQVLAKRISDAFIAGAESAKSFVKTLVGLRDEFSLLAKAWIALKIAGWVTDIKSATGAFGLLAGGVRQSRDAVTGLGTALGAVATTGIGAFTKLGNAVRSTVGFLSKAGNAAVVGLATNVVAQTYRAATGYSALKKAVQELWDANAELDHSSLRLADRFREISEQTGVAVKSMAELDAAIKSGAIVIDEQAGRYLSAAQAAEEYAKKQKEAAEASDEHAIKASALSAAYERVSESLKEAVDDNGKLASVMDDQVTAALNGGVEAVGGFVLALRSAEQQGKLTAEQIDTTLRQAINGLSEPEQLRFGDLIRESMEKIGDGTKSAGLKVEYLQRLLDNLNAARAEAALERLGVSYDQLAGKVTDAVDQSVKDLTIMGEEILKMGLKGKDTGDTIQLALTNALRNVKTEADKLALEQVFIKFQQQGLVTYVQVEELKKSLRGVADVAEEVGAQAASGLEPVADALDDVSDSADSASVSVIAVSSAGAQLLDTFSAARAEVAELGSAAEAMFLQMAGVVDVAADVNDLTGAIQQYSAEIVTANNTVGDSFAQTAADINKAKAATLLAYSEQKQKFEQYLGALQSGEGVTQGLINQAQNATQWMGLLGEQDLAQLRGALDDANAKLVQMQDAASNTLDQLQTELDRLQGNQDAINQRDYENKRQELQNAIEEAKRYGNQEAVRQYTEALRVLEEVRREKQKQTTEQRKASTSAGSSSDNGRTQSASPGSTTTIKLQSASGNKSVSLNGEPDAVNRLLSVLEDAGLRSAG